MSFAIRNFPGEHILRLDGAQLRYRDEGDGPPVVLIHGWPLDLEMWAPQVLMLRERWRVIRMDRRGFGASTGVPSIGADVRDLVSLLEHLDLHGVSLVGMSQGARVAMRATRHVEARLACLVLDGAPNDYATGEQDVPLERYRQLVANEGIGAFRREWLTHPLMQLHAAPDESASLLQSILDSYGGRDLLTPRPDAEAGEYGPVPPGAIRIPTLVLNGELDTDRRAIGDRLCAALPLARRAIIAGGGHLPNLDKPREYAEALARFIEPHRLAAA